MNSPYDKTSWPPVEPPIQEVITRTPLFQKRADFFGKKYRELIELLADCFSRHPSGMGVCQANFSSYDTLRQFVLDMKKESDQISIGSPLSEIFDIITKLLRHSAVKTNEVLFHEYIAPPGTFFIQQPFSDVQSDRLFGLPIFTLEPHLFDLVSQNFGSIKNDGFFYVNPKKPSDYFIVLKAGDGKPMMHEIGHFLLFLLKPEQHGLETSTWESLFTQFVSESVSHIACDDNVPPSFEQIYPGVPAENIPANIQQALYDLQFTWTLLTNRSQPKQDRIIYALLHSSSFEELSTHLAAMCISVPGLFPKENTQTKTTRGQLSETSGKELNDFLEEVFTTRIHVLECLRWLESHGQKKLSLEMQERKYPAIFCFFMWHMAEKMSIQLPDALKNAIALRIWTYPAEMLSSEEFLFLQSNNTSREIFSMYRHYVKMYSST